MKNIEHEKSDEDQTVFNPFLAKMALEVIEALCINDFVFDEKLVDSIYSYAHVARGECCKQESAKNALLLMYGRMKADGMI